MRLLRDEDEMDDIRLRSRLLLDSFFSSPLSSMLIWLLIEMFSFLWRLVGKVPLAAQSCFDGDAENGADLSLLAPGLEGVSDPFRDW